MKTISIILLFLTMSISCKSKKEITYKSNSSTTITVSSVDEFNNALSNVTQGTTILVSDGEYKDLNLKILKIGTEGAPIIVSAINPGKVLITGDYKWEILGDYIQFLGFHFTNGKRKIENDLILDKGNYNQYVNCKFNNLNEVTGVFIKLEGKYSTIKNCKFIGKTSVASYINIDVPKEGGSYHHISRNYFSRPPLGQNGGSAMRVGHGSMALNNAYITIEENLFENCDGEGEIVSVKSSRNYIRNNTFKTCKGSFSLRQGRGSIFEGNIFIGDGKKNCGGLTIRGRDHYVFNNYFYNLNQKKSGVINFGVASEEDPERIKIGIYPRHFPLTQDIVISHNTIIDNFSPYAIDFMVGYGTRNRFTLPFNIHFYNNVIGASKEFMNAMDGLKVNFVSNFYGGKNVNLEGVKNIYLDTETNNEIKLPSRNNEFKNNSMRVAIEQPIYGIFKNRDLTISKDVFDVIRDDRKDAGCFELPVNNYNFMDKVLSKKDVGSNF